MNLLVWQLIDSGVPLGRVRAFCGARGGSAARARRRRRRRARVCEAVARAVRAQRVAARHGGAPPPGRYRRARSSCATCSCRTPSRNRASRAQGRALLTAVARSFPRRADRALELRGRIDDGLAGHYAPLFGALFNLLDVTLIDTQRAFLFMSRRAASAPAAVRLGLIGAYEAQTIQADARTAHRYGHSRMRRAGAARHRANRSADRSVPVDARSFVFEVISIMSRPCFHHAQHPHTHDGDPTTAGIVQPAGLAEAPRLRRPLLHCRHRRPGRQRQDRAPAGAVPQAARSLSAGGRHERYLHEGRRRVPDAPRRAAVRAHPRCRDRRLPAHRHPRRHQPESRRARRADGITPSGAAVRRERRR